MGETTLHTAAFYVGGIVGSAVVGAIIGYAWKDGEGAKIGAAAGAAGFLVGAPAATWFSNTKVAEDKSAAGK